MTLTVTEELGGAPAPHAPAPGLSWVHEEKPGLMRADISAPDIRCAGCIAKIEGALKHQPGVRKARVNLSTKRITVHFGEGKTNPEQLLQCVEELGFAAHPYRIDEDIKDDSELSQLIWSLAVAGFAAGNVMLLSVSVWSGAADATRDLFHWLSALIALPAVVFAGRPFYRSAWSALKNFHLNMDVPISLAVILAAGMSLYEVMTGGEEAYFDASVTLLFFLLIGRTLDHVMRAKARSAVTQLVKLMPEEATRLRADGSRQKLEIGSLCPGMTIAVAPGERIPVDGEIESGTTDLDMSLVTGESEPIIASTGDQVFAGVMNLSGPLTVKVTATRDKTLLSDIVRLMEAAEQGKARYVRLATKAAEIYAPAIHILALLTFLGWLAYSGGDWHHALFIAISVLIITCPCALGLAVPVVQVVASGELFRNGVMVKDGAALEKLAQIDWVLFDKTGTLTVGAPKLLNGDAIDDATLALAAGLAQGSNHPLSRAVAESAKARNLSPPEISDLKEVAGCGVEGIWQRRAIRLGKHSWCAAHDDAPTTATSQGMAAMELYLAAEGMEPVRFIFEDMMRADVPAVVKTLREKGLPVEILSGDKPDAVERLAHSAGIEHARAGLLPQEKVNYLQALERQGNKALMVGDGLNDAPALSAAYTSMAPSSASDIGRTAADFIFLGSKLSPVISAIDIAKRARLLVHQNFALAALYNLIAIPIAVTGHASPLVAAIAMSTSSIVVTVNALRLRLPSLLSALKG